MSISSEITRLENAKAAIAAAIAEKGVTVPDGTKLDSMAALIDNIETGGGISVTGHITQTIIFTPTTATETIAFTVDNIDLAKPFNAFCVLLTSFFKKQNGVMGFYGLMWDGTNNSAYGGVRGTNSWPYIDYNYQSGFVRCTPPNIVVKGLSDGKFIPGEQYLLLIVQ